MGTNACGFTGKKLDGYQLSTFEIKKLIFRLAERGSTDLSNGTYDMDVIRPEKSHFFGCEAIMCAFLPRCPTVVTVQ